MRRHFAATPESAPQQHQPGRRSRVPENDSGTYILPLQAPVQVDGTGEWETDAYTQDVKGIAVPP